MRPLTTAIDKGEQKIPGEKHKAVCYALAPGDALRVHDAEIIKVTPEMARRAEYDWCLIWREGRVLAEFALDDMLVAQPIKPDPLPRRKRAEQLSGEGKIVPDAGGDDHHSQRRRGDLPPTQSQTAGGSGGHEGGASVDRTGAGATKRRTRRPPLL